MRFNTNGVFWLCCRRRNPENCATNGDAINPRKQPTRARSVWTAVAKRSDDTAFSMSSAYEF